MNGHRGNAVGRGAKNARVMYLNCQISTAKVIKDSDMLCVFTYNVRTLISSERLIKQENVYVKKCYVFQYDMSCMTIKTLTLE